jgi:hypothetical protein
LDLQVAFGVRPPQSFLYLEERCYGFDRGVHRSVSQRV